MSFLKANILGDNKIEYFINSQSDQSSGSSSNSSDSETERKNRYDYGDMSGADSDGSMINLRENLKQIGSYIRNREQLFDEMIRSIRGAKLQATLPDKLKVMMSYFISFQTSFSKFLVSFQESTL